MLICLTQSSFYMYMEGYEMVSYYFKCQVIAWMDVGHELFSKFYEIVSTPPPPPPPPNSMLSLCHDIASNTYFGAGQIIELGRGVTKLVCQLPMYSSLALQ
jgi:hypothetical protein